MAVQHGSIEPIKELLKRGAAPDKTGGDGVTALAHPASRAISAW